ncbi:MAG: hypothetical protein ABI297_00430 [Ginsengibacter sp.]
MDAIKLIGTSRNGKLTVSIPEELDNKELEIMVISSKEIDRIKNSKEKKEKTVKFMSLVGSD